MPQVNDFSWFNLSTFCIILFLIMVSTISFLPYSSFQSKYLQLKGFSFSFFL